MCVCESIHTKNPKPKNTKILTQPLTRAGRGGLVAQGRGAASGFSRRGPGPFQGFGGLGLEGFGFKGSGF